MTNITRRRLLKGATAVVLTLGTRLGLYEIAVQSGAGDMGSLSRLIDEQMPSPPSEVTQL